MTQHQPDPAPGAEPERGFLVAVLAQGVDADDELAEMRELLRTAGVEPVGELVQRRPAPDPRTYVGKGKLVELKQAVAGTEAESLLVDDDLDPGQQRRLEDELKLRVVDRTQLILDIFAQHATSAEGKLQVELAQLEYNLARMRGLWTHLERLGAGRIDELAGDHVADEGGDLWHRRIEELEAIVCALCAHRYAVGHASWLGDPEEGVVVLPGTSIPSEFSRQGVMPPVERLHLSRA